MFSSNNSDERTLEREEQREQFERRYHISAEDESNGHGDNSIQVRTVVQYLSKLHDYSRYMLSVR